MVTGTARGVYCAFDIDTGDAKRVWNFMRSTLAFLNVIFRDYASWLVRAATVFSFPGRVLLRRPS